MKNRKKLIYSSNQIVKISLSYLVFLIYILLLFDAILVLSTNYIMIDIKHILYGTPCYEVMDSHSFVPVVDNGLNVIQF